MVIGPTPPGTGLIAPATSYRLGEGDIAHEAAVRSAGNADVDHRRARRDPVAAHQCRLPNGGDEDVGTPALVGEIAGAAVRDRHRGVGREQERGERAPDDRRASEHRRPRAAKRDPARLQQAHDAAWRARDEGRLAAGEMPDIERVKAIDVLRGIDRLDDGLRVDRGGQWELHEDRVGRLVRVQPGDRVEKGRLAHAGGQMDGLRGDAGRRRGAVLVADIDRARRVVAHEDNGETGPVGQGSDTGRDLGAQGRGEGLSVEDACRQ